MYSVIRFPTSICIRSMYIHGLYCKLHVSQAPLPGSLFTVLYVQSIFTPSLHSVSPLHHSICALVLYTPQKNGSHHPVTSSRLSRPSSLLRSRLSRPPRPHPLSTLPIQYYIYYYTVPPAPTFPSAPSVPNFLPLHYLLLNFNTAIQHTWQYNSTGVQAVQYVVEVKGSTVWSIPYMYVCSLQDDCMWV